MEPVVDRIKKKYETSFREFTILNTRTEEGRDRIIVFGVTATPTFVILNDQGKELDRMAGDIPEGNLEKFIERYIGKAPQ